MSAPGQKRNLRPRSTASIAIAPATVTDLTSAIVLGLEARPYRELLAREHVPHARIGKRVIARVEDVLAALDRVAARQQDEPKDEPKDEPSVSETPGAGSDDGPGVDGLLARIGRRRMGGSR